MLRPVFLRALLGALQASAPIVALATEAAPSRLELSGYFKSLVSRSETVVPLAERYTLGLNRLRLKLQGRPADQVALDVQYDNELLLGSYLDTRQFALEKDTRAATYFSLQRNYAEHGGYYGRHQLYRASVTLAAPLADVKLGRQRIAWGTGRFWNPLDILNPLNPTRLERDERPGVDGVLVERKLGPLSRASIAYVPRSDRAAASVAGYGHGNLRGWDFSLIGGKFRDDRVAGADFATQIAGLGVRGEASYTLADVGRNYGRILLGADYGFANTLTLTAELYYDGQGTRKRSEYDFSALFAGRVRNVARRYAAISASYDITPLLKSVNYYVQNLDDGSRLVWPTLVYSLTQNVELGGGVQWFSGASDSEYGRLRNLFYLQLQWFF